MSQITRRTFVAGLSLSGTAGAAISAPLDVPAETLEAYRKARSAHERLNHHLHLAAQAMDELVDGPDCRWLVTMGGKSEYRSRWFRAERFDEIDDPEIFGLRIERLSPVVDWHYPKSTVL
jgi:hypothetical protein